MTTRTQQATPKNIRMRNTTETKKGITSIKKTFDMIDRFYKNRTPQAPSLWGEDECGW